MYPRLLHVYGPVWIHSYGFMIVLGLIVFMYFSYRHPARAIYLSAEHYLGMLSWGIGAALVGGRLFSFLTEWSDYHWYELFLPWVGGFGILGAIIGVLVVVPFYLKSHHIPVLPVFDLLALYAPLLQAISRIGCFLAGCCYGLPAKGLFIAVTYRDLASLAPLNRALHPTQLYASALSFLIFAFLLGVRYWVKKPGQLMCIYLMAESGARFFVELWRGDSVFLQESNPFHFFSVAQWVALCVFLGAAGFFFCRKEA